MFVFYDMEEIKQFELTTQEKNTISNVFDELAEISLILLAEGVKADNLPQMQTFDVVYHILENIEKDRGKQMNFCIIGIGYNTGKIEIQHNNMEEETKIFLENLITKQLEFFEKYTPKALEIFTSKGLHLLGRGKKIEEIG